MTTRGLTEEDFGKVAAFLDEGLKLAVKIQAGSSSKKLVDFEKAMVGEHAGEVKELMERVEGFATQFPFPS